MRMRHTTKARRGAAAAVLAAVMALTAAGCGDDGGGGGGKADGDGARASGKASAQRGEAKNRPQGQAPSDAIGEMKGPDGIALAITSVVRDEGGFVTVNGTLTNRGSRPFNAIHWLSKETEMKSRSSISGASLVDASGKKRYLVLRDTDGECLCSTGLTNIKPSESRPVFAQFPAPPADVNEVDFQLPTMPSVHVKISG
ncbi:hypothetical protein B7P34_22170 [Streptosporangium nondiastaticum]|uniref:Secreted protein n=1 Tax=Streptosporangium nondiastaticum TaxID=35764 RepID=A0A9X7JMX9_9ACTN|nr:hypothetical protein [Streptosporangium nondiastaticum]PSJ26586.1 hypothetical protein B7P34_22170 [Streptosporangium nondiastaticum]